MHDLKIRLTAGQPIWLGAIVGLSNMSKGFLHTYPVLGTSQISSDHWPVWKWIQLFLMYSIHIFNGNGWTSLHAYLKYYAQFLGIVVAGDHE